MNCGNNHLLEVLNLINNLQENATSVDNNSCSKPILGNNTTVYNTRPITFYLCNNEPLTINYGDGLESSIFRVENVCSDCVTVRLLNQKDDGTITITDEMATINIKCIAAIKCLNDISLSLL